MPIPKHCCDPSEKVACALLLIGTTNQTNALWTFGDPRQWCWLMLRLGPGMCRPSRKTRKHTARRKPSARTAFREPLLCGDFVHCALKRPSQNPPLDAPTLQDTATFPKSVVDTGSVSMTLFFWTMKGVKCKMPGSVL